MRTRQRINLHLQCSQHTRTSMPVFNGLKKLLNLRLRRKEIIKTIESITNVVETECHTSLRIATTLVSLSYTTKAKISSQTMSCETLSIKLTGKRHVSAATHSLKIKTGTTVTMALITHIPLNYNTEICTCLMSTNSSQHSRFHTILIPMSRAYPIKIKLLKGFLKYYKKKKVEINENKILNLL